MEDHLKIVRKGFTFQLYYRNMLVRESLSQNAIYAAKQECQRAQHLLEVLYHVVTPHQPAYVHVVGGQAFALIGSYGDVTITPQLITVALYKVRNPIVSDTTQHVFRLSDPDAINKARGFLAHNALFPSQTAQEYWGLPPKKFS